MRLFEIILILLNLYWIIAFLIKKNQKKEFQAAFAAADALFLIAHFLRDGYRWQMIPVYILALIFITISVKNLLLPNSEYRNGEKSKVAITGSIFAILLLIISAVLSAYVFPIISLPQPTGKFAIGSITMPLNINQNNGLKKNNFTIWYPSNIGQNNVDYSTEKYSDETRTSFSKILNLPDFVFNYFKYINTHIIAGAPPASFPSNFPVVFFTPDMKLNRFEYLYLIENLTSNGFIVAGFNDNNSGSENYNKEESANELVQYINAVFNQIEQMNNGQIRNILNWKFDLNKIGYIGHALGGSAVVQTIINDKRFNAGIDLNGTVLESVKDSVLVKPFLFINTTEQIDANKNFDKIYHNSTNDIYKIIIKNTDNLNFTDIPIFSPLFTSNTNAKRIHKIINSYTVAFFNQYLKNIKNPLMLKPSDEYPEVIFNKKNFIKEQTLSRSN